MPLRAPAATTTKHAPTSARTRSNCMRMPPQSNVGYGSITRRCSERISAQRKVEPALRFGAGAEDPPLALVDRRVVDARLSAPHQSVLFELPQLVAVAAPPAAVAVVALVLEPDRDAGAFEAPESLAQRVLELALPFLRQEPD